LGILGSAGSGVAAGQAHSNILLFWSNVLVFFDKFTVDLFFGKFFSEKIFVIFIGENKLLTFF
jgi:hypothetical protein